MLLVADTLALPDRTLAPVDPSQLGDAGSSSLGNAGSRPRWCILDDPPPASKFLEELEAAVGRGTAWDFLSYDRDVGRTLLPGLNDTSPCPPGFPLMQASERACLVGHNNRVARVGALHDGARLWYRQAPNEADCGARYGWTSPCACPQEIPAECDLERVLANPTDARQFGGRHAMTLVLSGEDKPWLSSQPLVPAIVDSGFFHTVFVEGKDRVSDTRDRRVYPDADGDTRFETYPVTMHMSYMRGREQAFLGAARAAAADFDAKRGVLAAWSGRTDAGASGDHRMPNNELDDHRMKDPPLAPGERGHAGLPPLPPNESNSLLTFESDDSAALEDFLARGTLNVTRARVPPREYFGVLAQHRFLLAPLGNGLQSPKFIEAVMMMTIPITKRYAAFDDLRAYGLPIVLVDDWAEVTPAKLEQWWAELSPRLEAARWVGTNRGMDSLLNGSCWRPQAGATAATPITDRNESLRGAADRARRRGAAPDGT